MNDIRGCGDLMLGDDGKVYRVAWIDADDSRRKLLGQIGECEHETRPSEREDYRYLLEFWRSLDHDARGEGLYEYHTAIGAIR